MIAWASSGCRSIFSSTAKDKAHNPLPQIYEIRNGHLDKFRSHLGMRSDVYSRSAARLIPLKRDSGRQFVLRKHSCKLPVSKVSSWCVSGVLKQNRQFPCRNNSLRCQNRGYIHTQNVHIRTGFFSGDAAWVRRLCSRFNNSLLQLHSAKEQQAYRPSKSKPDRKDLTSPVPSVTTEAKKQTTSDDRKPKREEINCLSLHDLLDIGLPFVMAAFFIGLVTGWGIETISKARRGVS
jgi:hypothetical protein